MCRHTDRMGTPVSTNNCEVRGAYTPEAFAAQQAKLVSAINGTDAEVVALMEVENAAGISWIDHPRDHALATTAPARGCPTRRASHRRPSWPRGWPRCTRTRPCSSWATSTPTLGRIPCGRSSPPALRLVTSASVWDINGDESVAFQYSRRNYNIVDFYAPDPFASSDHDPVVVGLDTGPRGRR